MSPPKQPRKLSVAEFQRVFKEVRDDINELQLHDGVFSGVVENLTKYPRLSANFPGFFSAFYSAMRTDLIIRLGRVYDPDGTGWESCTLARCLGLIRDNQAFFTDEAIKARLNEGYRTANRDYLAFHRPDLALINKDLDRIVKSRRRLINLRHKLYAHKDLETVLSGKRDEFLSTHDEVRELILLAHDIWNCYSQIWNASVYSHKTIGGDDYKWLFSYLRRGMKVKSVLDNRRFERFRSRLERVEGNQHLDDATLTDYSNRFLGFGHWDATVWFIGVEEAGGRTVEEVQARLRAWDEGGRKPLEDAPRFYPASGNPAWHGPNAEIQPTWKQLIRMLLLARGGPATENAILDYQRDQLGAVDGQTCLIELLPLPSPKTAAWNYAQWSALSWLQSRKQYIRTMKARRENELRRRVSEHQPKVVIFYGLELPGGVSLLPSWSAVAGGHFDQAFEDKRILLWRKTADSVFFVTRHPAAESDEYFKEIGRFLRDHHGKGF